MILMSARKINVIPAMGCLRLRRCPEAEYLPDDGKYGIFQVCFAGCPKSPEGDRMTDFVASLAAKSRVDAALVQKGIGVLLSEIQRRGSSELMVEVSTVIPNAPGLLKSSQPVVSPSPSTATSIAGLAGGELGERAQEASVLAARFSMVGFSSATLRAFLPVLLGALNERLAPQIMSQVEGLVPGLGHLSEGGGDMSDLLGKSRHNR